jgi:hypothetical protein
MTTVVTADEWSPSHQVARIQTSAKDIYTGVVDQSLDRAKYHVISRPELATLAVAGVAPADTYDIPLAALKHGVLVTATGTAVGDIIMRMPTVESILATGLKVGDTIDFFLLIDQLESNEKDYKIIPAVGGIMFTYGDITSFAGVTFSAIGKYSFSCHLQIESENSIRVAFMSGQ